VTLVACGEQARDDIITYLQHLYRGGLARDESFVWSGLVSASNDLYPEELYDDIKRAYDDALIEPGFIGLDDIDETLQRGKERVLDALQHNRRYSLITDTITEMEWWACFHPEGQAVPHTVSKAHPRGKLAQQKARSCTQGLRIIFQQPPPCCLRGVNQPVMSPQNRFSGPHAARLS
jgi:Protein of unknown function (DUF1186)